MSRERRHRPYVPQRMLHMPYPGTLEDVMTVLQERFKLSEAEAKEIRERLESVGNRVSANAPSGERPSFHNTEEGVALNHESKFP